MNSNISHPLARLAAVCLIGFAPWARCEEAAPPPAASAAAPLPGPATVEKIDATTFQIFGAVRFDSQTREIRFPAWVNMQKGLIEFPVVHRNGRTHEAIFATDILPMHLETAFRFLRYKPSREVFPTYPGVDPANPPEQWPDPVFSPADPAAHVQLFVSWTDAGKKVHQVDIRKLLHHVKIQGDEAQSEKEVRFESLAPHWVFTSTTEAMDKPIEPLGGSIVAIRTEEACCINTLGVKGIQSAEWFADSTLIPPPETPVTIHIRPAAAANPQESPQTKTP